METSMKKKAIIIVIVFSLILLLIGYLYFENNILQVSNYNIINNKIPDSFNNYKIIQISDFHNTKSKILTDTLVKEIKNNKPNIIVLTGDLVDANKTDIDTAIKFIERIKELAPIYFITGNHEANIPEYNILEEKLKDNNVIILDNKIEKLKVDNSYINLIGVDDPSIIHNSYISDNEIIKTSLNNIEYDKENYSILLSHRPELFDTYLGNDIDLVLSGHAHGGQFRIPFIGGVVAPNQGLFPKYTSGKFNNSKTTMIVSRGIGNSIIPFRINNRPELVVITLNNGD